jgi:hypothetical protein
LRARNKFLKKPFSEREIEKLVWMEKEKRFDNLPKTANKESLEVKILKQE